MEKHSVMVIEEFCSKKKLDKPVYEYQISEQYGNECKVQVLGHTAIGKGRSKRDAKREAATNLIAMLQTEQLDIDVEKKVNTGVAPFTGHNEKPAPQQCTSVSEAGAKPKSPQPHQKQAPQLNKILSPEEEEEQRFQKFKAYFELTDHDQVTDTTSVSILDRHNTFKNFPEELKMKALAIIEQKNGFLYKTDSAKAQALLSALKLKGKIGPAPTMVPMIMITLQCDIDAIFVETKEKIWTEIISYFDIMLR